MRQPDLEARERATAERLRLVARRLFLREILHGFAIGLATASAVAAAIVWRAFWPAATAGVASGIAAAAWHIVRRRRAWTSAAAACAAERAAPCAANVVVTARELIAHPERARPWVRARVLDDAMRIVRDVDPAAAAPLHRDSLWAAAMLATFAAVLLGVPERAAVAVRDGASRAASSVGRALSGEPRIIATITPPAYIGSAPRRLEDPARIDAVQGSRARLTLEGGGNWRVRFVGTTLELQQAGGQATTEMTLSENGYFSFERDDVRGGRGRLVPVAVTPDAAPTVRIDAPAKDLIVPNVDRTIRVAVSASDDFGLATLELRYTKVSGSGEQFEFTEGTLPIAIARGDRRAWSATGGVPLGRLELQPGDSLVYRAVARDRRPGDAGLASSDTYFIEVAGPGQVALEGFELPPDRERYALSQQMILLKIQRLRVAERRMTRDAVEESAAGIAAEQRAVRANFVFLTGGEVEDEEQEAEHSHEIQEGRLENSARREIMTAIQHMGRVEQALAAADTRAALPPARAAVEALQRAFGRNRYFLRTLPVRSRVDPSRRLSGELDEAHDWRRERTPASEPTAARAARRILAAVLNPADGSPIQDVAALGRLAEEALAVAPARSEWQEVSARLTALAEAVAARESAATIHAKLVAAVTPLMQIVRAHASTLSGAPDADRLRRAWIEGTRRP